MQQSEETDGDPEKNKENNEMKEILKAQIQNMSTERYFNLISRKTFSDGQNYYVYFSCIVRTQLVLVIVWFGVQLTINHE